MKKAKLISPIMAGSHGTIGKEGIEGYILAEDREHIGIFAVLSGVQALYAMAIPKDALTESEIATAEWLFDDASGSFYDQMAELIKKAPEGYVVTSVSDTEAKLVD